MSFFKNWSDFTSFKNLWKYSIQLLYNLASSGKISLADFLIKILLGCHLLFHFQSLL